MTNDQPTPLTAEQALLNAIWHSLESVPLGAVTDALPAIVAELRDYGYQITKAQVGMVSVIVIDELEAAHSRLCETHRIFGEGAETDRQRESYQAVKARVIAAAQPTDTGEGDND